LNPKALKNASLLKYFSLRYIPFGFIYLKEHGNFIIAKTHCINNASNIQLDDFAEIMFYKLTLAINMKSRKDVHIAVVGSKVSDTLIWKKVLMLVGEDNTEETKASGRIKIDDEYVLLIVTASTDIPSTPQNGIIFTETQVDPEKIAYDNEAVAYLFVNTKAPNSLRPSLCCTYSKTS
jgi:hypothetical protein